MAKQWRNENPEKVREIKRRWSQNNPGWWKKYLDKEKSREKMKRWRERNPLAWRKRYDRKMAENPKYAAEQSRKWMQNNRARHNALSKATSLKRKNRVPKWADLEAISDVYKRCPPGYEVDHVIPLQGELVSGLHVHYNLQYLTPLQNRKKRNYFQP